MTQRLTIRDIKQRKGQQPITCLTAYTTPMASLIDPHADLILVGDSLGMVLYGMESTLPVTLEMMCAHGKAVMRGTTSALVVVDMPFGSYQASPAQAFANAATLLQETGCPAVKLEGGTAMEPTIAFLVERGVAVMGHVGLKPQSVYGDGGYRFHGRTETEYHTILEDALAVERAGAFAVVLEGITASLAKDITARLTIPTIGIGASPYCDGQVLVTEDMLGLSEQPPSFVKQYANMRQVVDHAVASYAAEVRAQQFPATGHYVDSIKKQAG